MDPVAIEPRLPDFDSYATLIASTGWRTPGPEALRAGLAASLFGVRAVSEGRTVGCGRIVGDGAAYFYVQDLIVLPSFRRRGIGQRMLDSLMSRLTETAPEHAFVGLMAARGTEPFYERAGFQRRPDDRPGMWWSR